jgi:predicted transcriptional regulator
MPREARMFDRSDGSPSRAWWKTTANVPPNWIVRARAGRKTREEDLAKAMKRLRDLQENRPRAVVAIKAARAELRVLLADWETSYRKESFYNGLRILLELSRNGQSAR